MNFSQQALLTEALNYTNKYLSQKSLGSAEELQMLSCAYAHLYLKAASQGTIIELGEAHMLIANCFERLGDSFWAEKHKTTAAGYLK